MNELQTKLYSVQALIIMCMAVFLSLWVPLIRFVDVLSDGNAVTFIANLKADFQITEWHYIVFWPTILGIMYAICIALLLFAQRKQLLVRVWYGSTLTVGSITVLSSIINHIGYSVQTIMTIIFFSYAWYQQEQHRKKQVRGK